MHASSVSVVRPTGILARRPSPIIDWSRNNAFSTRACCWSRDVCVHRHRPMLFPVLIVRSRTLGRGPRGGIRSPSGACPWSAASARPVTTCATTAGRPGRVDLGASRGEPTGGVRPRRPHAVPRRTRRRGDAMRGAAGPTAWGRRRAGAACACCAR